MVVAGHPLHGLDIVANLTSRHAIITDNPVFLEQVHHLLFVILADCDPLLEFVFHFGLTESLITFKNTTTIPIQKI